ncbi:MAG: hypothetical protein RL220_1236 [Bacteroidota bacterium]
MKNLIVLFGLLCLFSAPLNVSAQSDSVEVLNVVQKLFDAIEQQDSIAFRALFAEDAMKYIAIVRNGEVIRTMSGAAAGRVPNSPGEKLLETMRSKGVQVEVHGKMAMAWVPYDFTINGEFSHCGIDACTLVKLGQEWKFALIAYTVEYDQCGDW